jgi:hypothetical protein
MGHDVEARRALDSAQNPYGYVDAPGRIQSLLLIALFPR